MSIKGARAAARGDVEQVLTWIMAEDEWLRDYSAATPGRRKLPMTYAAMMVHVDVERDCEQRIQVALALADRFQAALIGVAGLAPRPAFVGAGVAVYGEPIRHEFQQRSARLDDLGKKFRDQGQCLEQVEWRTAVEFPYELISREARAADLIIVGPRHATSDLHDLVDPGVVLLRAGRPILVVPSIAAPLALRRVIVAWKDTRECRRAVRDALPLLQQAKEVLLFAAGESEDQPQTKTHLADVTRYLARHQVSITEEVWRKARGPIAAELLHFASHAKADLIVAGGYGHSRLGEWIFGGVTHELLAASPMCCMLSH
jgi:nucleotide-binding universal stress UspA family protein